jgi:hypothetical protein
VAFITRNILKFYDLNKGNHWYLTKFFTNTKEIGFYSPHSPSAIAKEWNNKDSFVGTVDEENTYNINEFGFRGKAYEGADVLGVGCSITFGVGVPEDGRWTNFLSNRINKDVVNLGSPGASAETICNNIIQYCMNNKMPKKIFCLMPDFFRSMVVIDKEFYLSNKADNASFVTSDQLGLMYCNPKINRYNKNSIFMEIKDKKYIEDATSPHQLILDSVNFIYILESFCSTNNIKLYWTTWDLSTSLIMEKLNNIENFKLKNFTAFFPPNTEKTLGNFIDHICSLDHESEFKDSVCWKNGSDYSIINKEKVTSRSHPGIHAQYHLADFFYNLYSKDISNT